MNNKNEINDKKKIGLLILSTSKNRDMWVSIKDSYLYNLTLKTFLLTQNREHEYVFYIGIDKDDRIFDNKEQQEEILRFRKAFSNVDFKFMLMTDIPKGWVTKMWNKLFIQAYEDNCDYFYQCGDDINFKSKDWVNDCISILQTNNNIGLTGPINNNNRILTQAFVSRKHMEIFGWFFPEEIKNWCCDDWYNMVYSPDYLYPLKNHLCINEGGNPRYDIDNNPNFIGKNRQTFMQNTQKLRENTFILANNHKKFIEDYIKSNT